VEVRVGTLVEAHFRHSLAVLAEADKHMRVLVMVLREHLGRDTLGITATAAAAAVAAVRVLSADLGVAVMEGHHQLLVLRLLGLVAVVVAAILTPARVEVVAVVLARHTRQPMAPQTQEGVVVVDGRMLVALVVVAVLVLS